MMNSTMACVPLNINNATLTPSTVSDFCHFPIIFSLLITNHVSGQFEVGLGLKYERELHLLLFGNRSMIMNNLLKLEYILI